VKPGVKTWPGVVGDCRAAVQFVRANAADLGLDPDRIGMIGDSAGAHLAALVALAGDELLFSSQYRNDPGSAASVNVKAVVGFYGVYDMQSQWEHDQITRPRDSVTEKLLGGPPMVSRKTFFEASPLSYATVDNNSVRFLLIYGREDDIVDPVTQSEKFLTALKQAGFFARTIVVPGAGHFWSVDPVEEPGSFGAYAGPRVLRFLAGAL
jgi:acetyl esterase/lipase